MATTRRPDALPTELQFGAVQLRVRDLQGALEFYRDLLGLTLRASSASSAALGSGDASLIRLEAAPAAPAPPRHSTGLYHVALLLPSRLELARSVRQLLHAGYPLQGAADHEVSEAVYLADPEGNGLELYRDRPRSEWRFRQGQLVMGTHALDEAGLFATLESDERPWTGMASGARVGHLHLRVGDVAQAEAFYCDVLGFETMVRLPSAGFMSVGGYHHHLGFNTWESLGAAAPPEGSLGLAGTELRLPTLANLAAVQARAEAAGHAYQRGEGELRLRDPWRHLWRLTVPVG